MRRWSRFDEVMFGDERMVVGEMVMRHPGQQGQAMALGQREGGPGQEEEENLPSEIFCQIYHFHFSSPSSHLTSVLHQLYSIKLPHNIKYNRVIFDSNRSSFFVGGLLCGNVQLI